MIKDTIMDHIVKTINGTHIHRQNPTWLEISITSAKKENNSLFPIRLAMIDGRSSHIVPDITDIIKNMISYIINISDATD